LSEAAAELKRIVVTGLDRGSAPHSRQTVSQTSLWQLGRVVVSVFDAIESQSVVVSPRDSGVANTGATTRLSTAPTGTPWTVIFCSQVLLLQLQSCTMRV
jgi:hypothetical protein